MKIITDERKGLNRFVSDFLVRNFLISEGAFGGNMV